MPVLDDRMPKGGGIFAVYPHRRYLPAKVRVFVDFLVQWFKNGDERRRRQQRAATLRARHGPNFARVSGNPVGRNIRRETTLRTMRDRNAHWPMLAIAAIVASTGPASVHPHVFAEARLDVTVNPDQTVKSLRHLWRFDDCLLEHGADGVRQERRPEARRRRTQDVVEDRLHARSPSTIISSS